VLSPISPEGFLSWITESARIAAVKTQAVARHVLARAAAKVGGVAKLASRLNLSQRVLTWYVHGDLTVPDALFLKALDMILEELPETRQVSQQAAQSFPESKRDR
jgi:hypothetical protein